VRDGYLTYPARVPPALLKGALLQQPRFLNECTFLYFASLNARPSAFMGSYFRRKRAARLNTTASIGRAAGTGLFDRPQGRVNRQGKLYGRLVEDKIFGTPARSFTPPPSWKEYNMLDNNALSAARVFKLVCGKRVVSRVTIAAN